MKRVWHILGVLLLPGVVLFWLVFNRHTVHIERAPAGIDTVQELVDLSDMRLTGIEARVAKLQEMVLKHEATLRERSE